MSEMRFGKEKILSNVDCWSPYEWELMREIIACSGTEESIEAGERRADRAA